MDRDSVIAYSKMTESHFYRNTYQMFANLLLFLQNSYDTLNVTILGAGNGVMENDILSILKDVKIYSYDNNGLFAKDFLQRNKGFIDKGLLHYNIIYSPNQAKLSNDLIALINISHHIMDIDKYLKILASFISSDSLIYIEDLRSDVELDSLKQILNSVIDLPAFKDNRLLLYKKLIGFIESFAVSYNQEYLLDTLRKRDLDAISFTSDSKYYILASFDSNRLAKIDLEALYGRHIRSFT